ncbi:MAG: hypothetical protein AAFQ94_00035 [Bacteroidota bacterium]
MKILKCKDLSVREMKSLTGGKQGNDTIVRKKPGRTTYKKS